MPRPSNEGTAPRPADGARGIVSDGCGPPDKEEYMQAITNSRADTFKTCRRRHWFAYEVRLRPATDAKALRMGSAGHAGLEHLPLGIEAATAAVRDAYEHCPEHIDPYDWRIERETILRLVCGYAWRWGDDALKHLATEQVFHLPLRNPETNHPTPSFQWAGKIDGIVRLEDGRTAVLEHKFLGEALGTDAALWRRLRMDGQVSGYMLAARALGHDASTVLYDVIRKPTIKPTAIALLDDDGNKIVTDRNNIRVFNKDGWTPRQVGSQKDGWTLQTRPMTPGEWGEKLNDDIAERPDFYFARVEIARLDDELDEFRHEFWELQQALREAQRTNRWYRTVNRNTCPYCPYFELCSTKWHPARDAVPEGFALVDNVHPELEVNDGTESTPAPTADETEGAAQAAG